MKNCTLYTTIDNTPIYRTATCYFTVSHLNHSGGCSDCYIKYIGITAKDVIHFFFKERKWPNRFFSKECAYIFDEWLKASALPNLHPRC